MFIVQGLRRVQSESWPLPRIGNHEASMRAWFSGKPLWKGSSGSLSRKHPEGYERDTDESGTMCWKYGHQWLDLADSISLWEGNQQEQEEADLYSAD